MSKFSTLKTFSMTNQSGSASIEFGLVIALITLAVMAGLTASGDSLRKNYSEIGSAFQQSNAKPVEK